MTKFCHRCKGLSGKVTPLEYMSFWHLYNSRDKQYHKIKQFWCNECDMYILYDVTSKEWSVEIREGLRFPFKWELQQAIRWDPESSSEVHYIL